MRYFHKPVQPNASQQPLTVVKSFTKLVRSCTDVSFLKRSLQTFLLHFSLRFFGPPPQIENTRDNTDNCPKHRKPTGWGKCYRVLCLLFWGWGAGRLVSWERRLVDCWEAFTLRWLSDQRPTTEDAQVRRASWNVHLWERWPFSHLHPTLSHIHLLSLCTTATCCGPTAAEPPRSMCRWWVCNVAVGALYSRGGCNNK